MHPVSRRGFLRSSVGLAAAVSFGPALLGQNAPDSTNPLNSADADPFAPDSLFLTWQKDPTTTMTVQWVGPEATGDKAIFYAPVGGEVWQARTTAAKPFPNTDLKVHRCELAGLAPGSEY